VRLLGDALSEGIALVVVRPVRVLEGLAIRLALGSALVGGVGLLLRLGGVLVVLLLPLGLGLRGDALAEFVSIVSHELRTPLTSIAGSLDIVLSGYAGPLSDRQLRYVDMARQAATRMNQLVDQLLDLARAQAADDRAAVLHAYVGERENRRHRPGRAFERVDYRFDVLSDYGAFRDLQRHRMLTIEWQQLTPNHGYVRPDLIDAAGLTEIFDDAMARSAALYDLLKDEFPQQASYAVSMAYRLRYSMQFNAREAIHLLELRSSPQGHPAYRHIALEMHRLIGEQAGHHAVAEAMTHITSESPELERLEAERRAESRRGHS